jgi:predicted HTH domain antitoxin
MVAVTLALLMDGGITAAYGFGDLTPKMDLKSSAPPYPEGRQLRLRETRGAGTCENVLYHTIRTVLGRFSGGCKRGSSLATNRRDNKNVARALTVNLEIPESIAKSLRLPTTEVEPRLRTELAIALYSQGILPFGKASELAGFSRFGFADLLANREIPRHYTDDDLTQDLGYARGQ